MEDEAGLWTDPQVPSPARMWCYWSGGTHHTSADRKQAELIERRCLPGVRRLAVDNRQFISQATRWARSQGIGQHLDLGCGLPVEPVQSWPRAAYVDIDPEAAELTGTALSGDPGHVAVRGDIRDPGTVLEAVAGVIDPGEPVFLLFGMVLHFFPPGEARDLAAAWTALVAPGSYLAVSCLRVDSERLWKRLEMTAPDDLRNFTRPEFRALFGGMEMIPPGTAPAGGWRPGWADAAYDAPEAAHAVCGMGIKRAKEDGHGR